MRGLKGEFLALGTMSLENFSHDESGNTAIKVDKGGNKTCRADVLWYYLHTMTITGTRNSMFEKLLKLVKFFFTITHSNTEKDSFFKR